ncbi:MAG: hypothetical protein M1499_08195 [Firmicutes bacterium]|nr:hypothetical protein [Bacillota bacterium]
MENLGSVVLNGDQRPLSWNPEKGNVIREPLQPGAGHWVGAPSTYQCSDGYFLTYRYRRPRGEGRGFEGRIAHSHDGVVFDDIWMVHQRDLETNSLERFALTRRGLEYILYISYVDPQDNRWRIDGIIADRPDKFDTRDRFEVFTASRIGLEAVKDPVVVRSQGLWWMYVSCASPTAAASEVSAETLHASQDVYTTGKIYSVTGLAVSHDAVHYDWLGIVLSPLANRWDGYAARVSTVVRTSEGFLIFYDGSANVGENYEERTGLAVTADLAHLTRVSVSQPWLVSPNGTGALRYVDFLEWEDKYHFFYEYARADGSHELRMHCVTKGPE